MNGKLTRNQYGYDCEPGMTQGHQHGGQAPNVIYLQSPAPQHPHPAMPVPAHEHEQKPCPLTINAGAYDDCGDATGGTATLDCNGLLHITSEDESVTHALTTDADGNVQLDLTVNSASGDINVYAGATAVDTAAAPGSQYVINLNTTDPANPVVKVDMEDFVSTVTLATGPTPGGYVHSSAAGDTPINIVDTGMATNLINFTAAGASLTCVDIVGCIATTTVVNAPGVTYDEANPPAAPVGPGVPTGTIVEGSTLFQHVSGGDYAWTYTGGAWVLTYGHPHDENVITTVVVPDSAFADPANPTEAEAQAWVVANGQPNTNYYVEGAGDAINPDYLWIVDGTGDVKNAESPECETVFVTEVITVTDGMTSFTPTGITTVTDVELNGNDLRAGIDFAFDGTTVTLTQAVEATTSGDPDTLVVKGISGCLPKAGGTGVSSLTQDATTGVIGHIDGNGNPSSAFVVSGATGNFLNFDQGAYLGCSTFTPLTAGTCIDNATTSILACVNGAPASINPADLHAKAVTDKFVATDGQTVFTLSNAYDPAHLEFVFVDGEHQEEGYDYTIAGNTVTLTPGNANDNLLAGERVVVKYYALCA